MPLGVSLAGPVVGEPGRGVPSPTILPRGHNLIARLAISYVLHTEMIIPDIAISWQLKPPGQNNLTTL